MRVLFVAPSETSSGEVITALHMAEALRRAGDEVTVLASRPAAAFLRGRLGEHVVDLGPDAPANRQRWDNALRAQRPDIVVFADYPLLFFSSGAPPLADQAWVRDLDACDAALVTLDHLGYAQAPRTIHFGPPHLSLHAQTTPALPRRMRVLLPCPGNHPGPVAGRRGDPFRYWDGYGGAVAARAAALRARFAPHGERLVAHSIPKWAQSYVAHYGLPHYAFLTAFLERYLGGLDRPVVVVSVNDGRGLAPSSRDDVRIVNVSALPAEDYEALLLASDLMLTDNAVSVSLGKAICAGVPCAVLANGYRLSELAERDDGVRDLVMAMERARPGAIFPYEVFPMWNREDLDDVGVLRDNAITSAYARLEIFGGEATRAELRRLLAEHDARATLRDAQRAYAARVGTLPDPIEAVRLMAAVR